MLISARKSYLERSRALYVCFIIILPLYPLSINHLCKSFHVYQNFHRQNKFYLALELDYMVFLSCNDKIEMNLDLKTGVYRKV